MKVDWQNKYIQDFRRWIIENHNNIQRKEIKEMCSAVEQNIKEVQENTFIRYLEDNSGYSLSKSTGSTILKMAIGMTSPAISAIDAFAGCIDKGKNFLDAKSLRWQGFIITSRNTMKRRLG